jgi:aminoglycoside phosphotransferase (APT) family kinase protein
LPDVIDDPPLLEEIRLALKMYDGIVAVADDHVLVHGDLGLHNIAVDPATIEVRGVFDYDGAAWADRHHDFRYLLFDHRQDNALEARGRHRSPERNDRSIRGIPRLPFRGDRASDDSRQPL